MALSLPEKTPDIGTELPIIASPIARTLDDLEEFCKHARIYGHDDNTVITATDKYGVLYTIVGFTIATGNINLGEAN